MRQKRKREPRTIASLLASLQEEVEKHGQFVVSGNFDVYLATLKSSFVKSYDFARLTHRIPLRRANESSFFMTASLRAICEDIIALKFIATQFPGPIRQELMILEMGSCVRKVIHAQTKFFRRERPFQQVVVSGNAHDAKKEKQQYASIGQRTGLRMIKDKLPAIEQMAVSVGLRELYDYFYRVTSESVHFNVHVALRNGWGSTGTVRFGTKSFCRYYLSANQTYGVFLFCLMCETFATELGLDHDFLEIVARMRKELDRQLRWPEPVTFEEMNLQPPSPILTAALMVAHLEKTDPDYVKSLHRKIGKKRRA
jgi:hypothetical protein